MEPTIEHHKRVIEQRARQVANDAARLGLALTVQQRPIGSGCYTTQVVVIAARDVPTA